MPAHNVLRSIRYNASIIADFCNMAEKLYQLNLHVEENNIL